MAATINRDFGTRASQENACIARLLKTRRRPWGRVYLFPCGGRAREQLSYKEQRRLLSDWLIIFLVPRFLKRARQ